ncbi:alkaline phosphatase family protein [Streptomyces sp. NBC_01210]|uniref:alkaline phosphatase family protein n=1 Tax=Streptomyces sp. NBC_01210 TaxID=2903774 RepID=UPI002E0E80EE|nr:alkaline phosphatase family protein [Streptomyces sp. NBC_01210]
MGLGSKAEALDVPMVPDGTSTDKVLVIGLDGTRYERMLDADVPNIRDLMSSGTYGSSLLYCEPVGVANSDAGWSTIATGVWPSKHGITGDTDGGELTDTDGNFDSYPTFFQRLDELDPDLSTFSALDWTDLDDRGATFTPPASSPPVSMPSMSSIQRTRVLRRTHR